MTGRRRAKERARAAIAWGTTALADLRETTRHRRIATAVGAVVGLVAATVDPLGIAIGAALVALPAEEPMRGLGAGLAFGALVLALFAGELALVGSLDRALATGTPFWLAVGTALGGGLLGGLVRSVV